MADQKRVALDVFDHLREDYAPALGWKHLRASSLDDLRFNATDADGTELIITARIVGGSSGNSQKYRGWVLESKPGWRRIEAERPAGFLGLLLMVGLQPHDEGIWWSDLYREDKLRGLTRYEIMNGRMSRVPESMAKEALVRKVDLLQTELFPEEQQVEDGGYVALGDVPDGSLVEMRGVVAGGGNRSFRNVVYTWPGGGQVQWSVTRSVPVRIIG